MLGVVQLQLRELRVHLASNSARVSFGKTLCKRWAKFQGSGNSRILVVLESGFSQVSQDFDCSCQGGNRIAVVSSISNGMTSTVNRGVANMSDILGE